MDIQTHQWFIHACIYKANGADRYCWMYVFHNYVNHLYINGQLERQKFTQWFIHACIYKANGADRYCWMYVFHNYVNHLYINGQLERQKFTQYQQISNVTSKKHIQWASNPICIIGGCAYAGNAKNVFPATDFRGNHTLAIPACITARASRTCRYACRDR